MTAIDRKSDETNDETKRKETAPSKHTPTYWKKKIRKLKRRGSETSNYFQTIQFEGKRRTISLGTGERNVAAAKAASNWKLLQSSGNWSSLFPEKKESTYEDMTVAQFLEVAKKRAKLRGVRDGSVKGYEDKLRAIIAGILGVSIDTKCWNTEKRQRAKTKVYVAKIAKTLTKKNVEAFKQRYLQQRLAEGHDEKRIKRTFNSYLRGAKALFSTDTLKEIPGAVDPFSEVENWPKCSKTFQSVVPDFDKLIKDFNQEFATPRRESETETDFVKRREVFKNFVIILATGARRGEADRLEWRHIDLENATCTFEGNLKTENSEATIPLNPQSLELLRQFRKESPDDEFYLKRAKQRGYESGATSEALMNWLRNYEVAPGEKPLSFRKTPKAIHYLRAEVGNRHWNQFHDAAMAASYLRHDPQTFLKFYGDLERSRKAPSFGLSTDQSNSDSEAEKIRDKIAALERQLRILNQP